MIGVIVVRFGISRGNSHIDRLNYSCPTPDARRHFGGETRPLQEQAIRRLLQSSILPQAHPNIRKPYTLRFGSSIHDDEEFRMIGSALGSRRVSCNRDKFLCWLAWPSCLEYSKGWSIRLNLRQLLPYRL